jgi:ABC-type phosphate transport system substrate-binding protein
MQFPTVIGGVVPGQHYRNTPGQLKLTGPVLGDIFQARSPTDRYIMLNFTLTLLPDAILPLVRPR